MAVRLQSDVKFTNIAVIVNISSIVYFLALKSMIKSSYLSHISILFKHCHQNIRIDPILQDFYTMTPLYRMPIFTHVRFHDIYMEIIRGPCIVGIKLAAFFCK